MKWRNSKERELLSGNGSRDAAFPTKSNSSNDEEEAMSNKIGHVACKQLECTQTKPSEENTSIPNPAPKVHNVGDVDFEPEHPLDEAVTSTCSSESEDEIDVS